MCGYALITLHMSEHAGIYLKKHVEYTRIIQNLPNAVHSIRSL